MEENRRNFLKKSGAAIAGLTALAVAVKETRATTSAKNSWMMIIDLNRCTGCQSCVIACKAHNRSAEGVFKTRIAIGEAANGSTIKATYTPIVCKQCKEPPCGKACGDNAVAAGSDGIVRVDPQKCPGAARCASKGRCVDACSLKAGHLNPDNEQRFEKCTFCRDRLARGLLPVCVENCPSGARIFGNPEAPGPELAAYLQRGDLREPPGGGVAGSMRYVQLRGDKGELRV